MKKTIFLILISLILFGCSFGDDRSKLLILTEESDSNDCYLNTYTYEDEALKLIKTSKYEGHRCGYSSSADSPDFQPYGDGFTFLNYLYDEDDGYSMKPIGFEFKRYNPLDGTYKNIATLGGEKLISRWKNIPQGILVITWNSNYDEDHDFKLELIDYSSGVMTELVDIELNNSDTDPFSFSEFFFDTEGDLISFFGEDVLGHVVYLLEYKFSKPGLEAKQLLSDEQNNIPFSVSDIRLKDRIAYYDVFNFSEWKSNLYKLDIDTMETKISKDLKQLSVITFRGEDLLVSRKDRGKYTTGIMKDDIFEKLLDGRIMASNVDYFVYALTESMVEDMALYDFKTGISIEIPTVNKIYSIYLTSF